MSDIVECLDDLEAVVGARPAAAMLKSIPFLDEHCHAVSARATLVVVGWLPLGGAPRMTTIGGASGFAATSRAGVFELPGLRVGPSDDGAPAALLVLVPGFGETLRVNGVLRAGSTARLDVTEAFVHCAKALLRSRLWQPAPQPVTAGCGGGLATAVDPLDLLARSPFAALFSVDAAGGADVSPKGDPAGFVRRVGERLLAIPDRPGNRRTDTMHNVLERNVIAVLALVPGESQVLEASGSARISTDPALLASMEVQGHVPSVALLIEVERAQVRDDPGLVLARLWDAGRHVAAGSLPKASAMWADHVRAGEVHGPHRVLRGAVTPASSGGGVPDDYAKHLY